MEIVVMLKIRNYGVLLNKMTQKRCVKSVRNRERKTVAICLKSAMQCIFV